MSPIPFYCHLCNDKPLFTRKFNLDRHIATKHGKSPIFFECAECNLRFNRKDNLTSHIVRNHTNDRPTFKCAHCAKTFDRKFTLRNHIAALHLLDYENTNNIDDERDKNFTCAYCLKTFGRKFILRKHITVLHPYAIEQNHQFECFLCSSAFGRSSNLRRHIQMVHSEQKRNTKQSRLTCLKCSNTFRTTKVLNKHYVDVHGVVLNYEILEFDRVESYKEWLENHQRQTLTQFALWYKTKNTASFSIQRFICHRSRHVRSTVTVDSRKRHLKMGGYKRLGGICPAEIRLYIRENGTCMVEYQKTHVGHNVGDESELGLMNLTNEEKKNIAAEIQSGIPLAQIVKRKRLSNASVSRRLSLVTRQDVRNIATSQRLGFENCEYVQPRCDTTIDVDMKIKEHDDDILFYKRQDEEDSRFEFLRKEDFVLIVMTSNQETYLRSYGHKIICLDGTFNTNSYGFLLHTLMVIDTDCEGLTAAFLLTNRDDERVVDIFFTCVRDRVGILKPQTLITDTQPTYLNSWIKIMNVPEYYLFCIWHVHEEWRKNSSKIADKKKRDDVRNELQSLSFELDPIKFENGLDSFLTRNDDELADFQNYFRRNYGTNAQQWAYCYRTRAGINTNTNLETFHKSLKYNIARGQKIRSMNQCLVFIFDYLTLLERNIVEKKIRRRITNKLYLLRKRHKIALEEYNKNETAKVIVGDENMYMVQSSQSDRLYTIWKYESKECDCKNNTVVSKPCRLFCDSCNLCFHSFSCTCEDSSIKSNMCKHIHLVGLYRKDKQSQLDADRFKFNNDEIDVPVGYTVNDEDSSPIVINDEVNRNETVIEIVGGTRRKRKFIQQMKSSLQDIEEKLATLPESKLQRMYNELKSTNFPNSADYSVNAPFVAS